MYLAKEIARMYAYLNNTEFQLVSTIIGTNKYYSNTYSDHAEMRAIKGRRLQKSRYFNDSSK